jgi:hypothetical protein
MMFHQYHRSKSIRIRKAGKMDFSGGATNSFKRAAAVMVLAVMALCVIIARIILMADLA